MFDKILLADNLRHDVTHLAKCLPGKRLGAKEIILCHSFDPPKDMPVDKMFYSKLEATLEERRKTLASLLDLPCKVELVRGEPARAILELAEEHDVSMIVMGSHHSGGLRGSLIGSVSYSLLHETIRPVFLLRMSRTGRVQGDVDNVCGRHIFFPTDFSETAEDAFLLLERIATSYNAKVTMFHVHDKARIDPYLRHMLPEFDREDKARLQRLKEHLEANGAGTSSFQVSYGVPAQRILRLANSGEFSLMVIGCQGRGFIPEIFLGSTANAVARHGEIPVIFVPRRRGGMSW
ncbi:MAG: universal stress protein [Thermodesulfobacteria bacterium]|nr:universal stress protein [Thermodesulfobacteriota bacterium]